MKVEMYVFHITIISNKSYKKIEYIFRRVILGVRMMELVPIRIMQTTKKVESHGVVVNIHQLLHRRLHQKLLILEVYIHYFY